MMILWFENEKRKETSKYKKHKKKNIGFCKDCYLLNRIPLIMIVDKIL